MISDQFYLDARFSNLCLTFEIESSRFSRSGSF